jgi:hypothetical protein
MIIIALNDSCSYLILLNSRVDLTSRHCFLWILLLMSLIGAVQSTLPCNSFPKIFGGSLADTYLYHIDAFNDYLALAGDTWENSLTGISIGSTMPYLALASISGGGKYYWAKALYLKTDTSFFGV